MESPINISNFSLSGGINTFGTILPSLSFNPPLLGGFLIDIAHFDFLIFNGDDYVPLHDTDISDAIFYWPIPKLSYKQYDLTVRAFSPISFNDIKTTSLPILFIELSSLKDFSIIMDYNLIRNNSISKQTTLSFFVSTDNGPFIEQNEDRVLMNGKHIILSIVVWHNNLYSSNFYSSAIDMINKIDFHELLSKTIAISNYLPEVRPEEQILLNQEIVPAFSLTRVMKNSQLITMGYCELNQRDSYWTSFVHLLLFKEAEITMINESCQGQLESGKIPTTLLPLIEREFDIDISAYFVLRIVRFVRYYYDESRDQTCRMALQWIGHARKAIDYLYSLLDKNNIPFARDFWADWKDVKGMNNRLYGPHFVLLTKAAIKEYKWLYFTLKNYCQDHSIDSNHFFHKTPFTEVDINADLLWNGQYYQDIMRDGSSDKRFHQDQLICELWNICGENRFQSMLKCAEQNQNQFGLPETVPFYPDSFGYQIGDYHNGGIWPWLSFADAAARMSAGYFESGEKLLLDVCKADILLDNDLCSNEFLNGITGKSGGHRIQGWNACAILPFSLRSNNPRNNLAKLVQDMRE